MPRAAGHHAPVAGTARLHVVSNTIGVATFTQELVLEPTSADSAIDFTPGDYLQIDIPSYAEIRFRDFDIPAPFAAVWERQHVFDLVARNPATGRRNNYSLASNPQTENVLRFNVRVATPPPGQDCPPGVGSSYVFSLKPSDEVTAIGPFGDFHAKPTQREMVTSAAGRAWPRCGLTCPTCLIPSGPLDASAFGMGLDPGRRFFTRTSLPAWPPTMPIFPFTSPCPIRYPGSLGPGSPGSSTKWLRGSICSRTRIPAAWNTNCAGRP